MKPPIIDTLEAMNVVHEAFQKCGDGRAVTDLELYRTACSAFSAVIPYIRHPKAPVQNKHFEAVQALYKAMGK